jgi:hypothetical protein
VDLIRATDVRADILSRDCRFLQIEKADHKLCILDFLWKSWTPLAHAKGYRNAKLHTEPLMISGVYSIFKFSKGLQPILKIL